MKKLTIFCGMVFLLVLTVAPAAARDGYYHGGMNDGKDKSPHGMMMQQGDGMDMMGGQACPMCGMRMGRGEGMMQGMHGMMMGGMAPSFYLDKKDKLGLDQRQVQQLRDIRRDFRKKFIRQSAEMKLARLEMEDAFQGDWSVEEAEKQLRQIQQLRTEMVVDYLKARKQAEQVLTAEQRQMVRGEMDQ